MTQGETGSADAVAMIVVIVATASLRVHGDHVVWWRWSAMGGVRDVGDGLHTYASDCIYALRLHRHGGRIAPHGMISELRNC